MRRVACCHAPALGDVAKYEGFVRALCGALVDAGDDLCNGTGMKNEVEALAHTLPSVLVALEPERAAECIEEALIDEAMSPGACLALRVVLKEEALLCSADDEAPRLAYRSIVKLAQALDEDRAPKNCGEVGIGLLRCLTVMEAAGINAEGRTWWVPEAFAFLQTVLSDIEKRNTYDAYYFSGESRFQDGKSTKTHKNSPKNAETPSSGWGFKNPFELFRNLFPNVDIPAAS